MNRLYFDSTPSSSTEAGDSIDQASQLNEQVLEQEPRSLSYHGSCQNHCTDSWLSHWLLPLGLRLCHLLLGEATWGLTQPRVTWKRNRTGQSFYQVHDPETRMTHRFETMTETRRWLESRYSR